MWGKRIAVSLGIMAMVLVALAGCGRPAAQKKNEARESAEAFYRAFVLGGDFGRAWDLMTDDHHGNAFGTREEFIKFHTDLRQRTNRPARPDAKLEVEEHSRADDRLYLISDSQDRYLIWVTKTPKGWLVRNWEKYEGGPIPWSSASSQRYS